MILIVFVFIFISFGIAAAIADRTQLEEKGLKGFLWGYFVAVSGVAAGLFMAIAAVTDGVGDDWENFWLIQGLLLAGFSVMVFRRTRLGWIGATIVSLNPLWWIINSVYGWNRWGEFKPLTSVNFKERWHLSLSSKNQRKALLICAFGFAGMLVQITIHHIDGGNWSGLRRCLTSYCPSNRDFSPTLFWINLALIGACTSYIFFKNEIIGWVSSVNRWINSADNEG